MSKAVAVEGDTQVETSTAKLPADTGGSGSWQPGTLAVTTGETISVNGKKVELSAVMTWTYTGGTTANGSSIPPVPPDTATLTASPTKLTDANQHVLVEGDEATTVNGNKIIVTKSQEILKTA
jgi:hypothetical protein